MNFSKTLQINIQLCLPPIVCWVIQHRE